MMLALIMKKTANRDSAVAEYRFLFFHGIYGMNHDLIRQSEHPVILMDSQSPIRDKHDV